MSISNLSNPKSILAKLLAQENLSIEHRKTATASFDPVNRVLCLPIWKDMSSDLYDLLVGHEVGHAWETPPKGWHTAIEEKGKGFKSFLNVVEDARIERAIKNRYPGLRAPFYRGYNELMQQDFFGLDKMKVDLKDLTLIDRLNLHFKVGPFINVPFHDEEQIYVDRMNNLSTWDEVYQLASELYLIHEDKDTRFDLDEMEWKESYDDGDEDFDDYEEYESDDERQGKNRKGGKYNPEAKTDSHFRDREQELIADHMKPYVYCNLPEVDPREFIIHYKDIYSNSDFSKIDNFEEVFKKFYGSDDIGKYKDKLDVFNSATLFREYREKNLKYIQYLVKEFELKRNAAQYARASVSKSGELDLEKVWAYKLKEDLFKRITKIPHGKNHGMVMFVDWSGSMTENLSNTIEQTLILSDFCKKVGIPFEVYAFTDNHNTFRYYRGNTKRLLKREEKSLFLDFNGVNLLNFLSSSMSSSEYRKAQYRLLQIAEGYRRSYDYKQEQNLYFLDKAKSHSLPGDIGLSGTPLDEAIVLAHYIVPHFKTINKLDIVNTIFLTDGDGNENTALIQGGNLVPFRYLAQSPTYNLVLKDKQTGLMAVAKPGQPVTVALLSLLKTRTDTNLVGYFISNRSMRSTIINMATHYGQFIPIEEAMKEHRKYKYYGMAGTGYDKYFLVLNKDMEIQDSNLDTNGDNSKNALRKAFIVNQKNKLLNRVLITKFIEQIA